MSEYREPVNRVKAISGDTKDPKTLHAHFESAATDVDRQVLASAPQAAQAIERLEREVGERIAELGRIYETNSQNATLLREAECELADARAEIERLEREGNEREKQYADLLASHEEDLEALEKAEQQLADARAEIERKDKALDQAKAAIWDAHYGNGIAVEYARSVDAMISEALAAPAPEERLKQQVRDYEDTQSAWDIFTQHPNPTTEREAERRVVEAVKPLAHFVRHSLGAGPATNMPGREGDLWRGVHSAIKALAAQQQENGDEN